MRGWSNYFKHAVAKYTTSSLENFLWHKVIRTAGDGRTSADTTLAATAAERDPRRMGSSCSTSPRSRSPHTGVAAPRSPTPGSWPTPPDDRHSGEPVAWKLARRVRRAARTKRTDGNIGTAPKADSTIAIDMPSDQRRGGFVAVFAQVWQKWRTTGADRGGIGRTGLRLLEHVLRGVSEVL